jgi:hypothetical protein
MYLPKTLFDYGSDKSGAWLEFWARRCDQEGRGGIDKTLFLSRMEGFEFKKRRCDTMWLRGIGSQRFRYDPKTATIYWTSRHKQGIRNVNLGSDQLKKIQKIGDVTAVASAIVATNVIAKSRDCIARGRTLKTIANTTDTFYKSTVSARLRRAVKKGLLEIQHRYVNEWGQDWQIRNDYSSPIKNIRDRFTSSVNCPRLMGTLKYVLPSIENVSYVKNGRHIGVHHPVGYTSLMDVYCKDLFSAHV